MRENVNKPTSSSSQQPAQLGTKQQGGWNVGGAVCCTTMAKQHDQRSCGAHDVGSVAMNNASRGICKQGDRTSDASACEWCWSQRIFWVFQP